MILFPPGECLAGEASQSKLFEAGEAALPESEPSVESPLKAEALDAVIAEQGIERSDRASSYFLIQAEKALQEGDSLRAIRIAKMAEKISPSSPLPAFFLADIHRGMKGWTGFVAALSYFLKGIGLALRDMLFLLPLVTLVCFLSFIGVFLAGATFILYSLVSYAPFWVHHILERSKGVLNTASALVCFLLLLFFPILAGLPMLWFVLLAFLLFWPFYSKGEKGIVFMLLGVLGTMAWTLPLLITLFTARNSLLIDEMARNHHSDYLWTPFPSERVGSEWEAWFIRASYEAQRGHYEQATRFYQNALGQNPQSPLILNNLGNLAFYKRDYPEAIRYYEESIKVSPATVSAYFNLSQTYREMLMFEKGERLFLKAVSIDEETAKAYAMKAVRYPDFPVVEERFVLADIWKRFFEQNTESLHSSEVIWKSWAGQLPLKKAPLLVILWAALLFSSSFLYDRFFSGKPCAFCKQAICGRCAKRLFSYEVCASCQRRYRSIQKKSDFWIIEDAVKTVPKRLYPLLILPGCGHLVIRRAKTAALVLFVFYVALSGLFFGNEIVPTTEWYLHRTESQLPKVLLVFLCLFTSIDLILKRKNKKWL